MSSEKGLELIVEAIGDYHLKSLDVIAIVTGAMREQRGFNRAGFRNALRLRRLSLGDSDRERSLRSLINAMIGGVHVGPERRLDVPTPPAARPRGKR